MKVMLEIAGTVLGFALLTLVIQFILDPQAFQQNVVSIINVLANVYHSAVDAFSR